MNASVATILMVLTLSASSACRETKWGPRSVEAVASYEEDTTLVISRRANERRGVQLAVTRHRSDLTPAWTTTVVVAGAIEAVRLDADREILVTAREDNELVVTLLGSQGHILWRRTIDIGASKNPMRYHAALSPTQVRLASVDKIIALDRQGGEEVWRIGVPKDAAYKARLDIEGSVVRIDSTGHAVVVDRLGKPRYELHSSCVSGHLLLGATDSSGSPLIQVDLNSLQETSVASQIAKDGPWSFVSCSRSQAGWEVIHQTGVGKNLRLQAIRLGRDEAASWLGDHFEFRPLTQPPVEFVRDRYDVIQGLSDKQGRFAARVFDWDKQAWLDATTEQTEPAAVHHKEDCLLLRSEFDRYAFDYASQTWSTNQLTRPARFESEACIEAQSTAKGYRVNRLEPCTGRVIESVDGPR